MKYPNTESPAQSPFDERAFFAFEIIRMIELQGLPSAIAMRPSEAERGPLAVTLVGELAAFLHAKLFSNQWTGRWPQELEVFLAKTAGHRYVQLHDDSNRLRGQRASLEQKLLNLERLAVSHGRAKLVGNPGERRKLSKSLSGEMIEWIPGPFVPSAHSVYDLLMRQLNECLPALKLAENQLKELTEQVMSRLEFRSTFGNHLLESMLVRGDYILPRDVKGKEFSIDIYALAVDRWDGAAFLLKTKDPTWHNLLARHLENVFKRTIHAGCKRVVLRNPDLNRIVSEMRNGMLYYGKWATVLSQLKDHLPHRGWPTANESIYSVEAIRKALRATKKEDETLRAWTLKNGGESHPFLFADVSTNSAIRPMPKLSFPPDRALNELHWVLSKGRPQEFSPETSTLYPMEEWREWLQSAESGKPPLWINGDAGHS